jgi:hypothetical protein
LDVGYPELDYPARLVEYPRLPEGALMMMRAEAEYLENRVNDSAIAVSGAYRFGHRLTSRI